MVLWTQKELATCDEIELSLDQCVAMRSIVICEISLRRGMRLETKNLSELLRAIDRQRSKLTLQLMNHVNDTILKHEEAFRSIMQRALGNEG